MPYKIGGFPFDSSLISPPWYPVALELYRISILGEDFFDTIPYAEIQVEKRVKAHPK